MASTPKFFIVEADFYKDLAEELAKGATQTLDAAGVAYDRVQVPGALEIPAAIALAADTRQYCGFIALGCVIRGETSHYDIVAGESARALQDLALDRRLALGNGILTVENADQAWARARVSEKNKGRDAAEATLAMWGLKKEFGLA